MKRFIYEFNGKIWLDASNQDEAENILIEKLDNPKKNILKKFIVDEDVYEVDQFYVANNLNKREQDCKSFYHPVIECEEYSEYKKRYPLYNEIFKDFLHGKINKKELIDRMENADTKKKKSENRIIELRAYDLESELKTVRHFFIEEKYI